jgi:hypothetical protein
MSNLKDLNDLFYYLDKTRFVIHANVTATDDDLEETFEDVKLCIRQLENIIKDVKKLYNIKD